MGLTIISKREGASGEHELQEFKQKVKSAKRLIGEICEDVEAMEEEFGGYSERGSYREGYRDGYRERNRYHDDEEIEMRRRRY